MTKKSGGRTNDVEEELKQPCRPPVVLTGVFCGDVQEQEANRSKNSNRKAAGKRIERKKKWFVVGVVLVPA